jgi:predicted nucleotidyltransferase
MIDLLQHRRPELAELCQRYRVRTLEVFGSAADGSFDPSLSDLDFLVEFLPLDAGQHARAYFGLLHALEDLFATRIDLVMTRAIQNPYFKEGVNRSRQVIYAA